MNDATTELHIRQTLQIAHRERAQAFADAWGWIQNAMSLRRAQVSHGVPVGC